MNAQFIINDPERDLLILLHVDVVMTRGEAEQVEWIFNLLEQCFECIEGGRLHWRGCPTGLPLEE